MSIKRLKKLNIKQFFIALVSLFTSGKIRFLHRKIGKDVTMME
jgi:hypothetical protein